MRIKYLFAVSVVAVLALAILPRMAAASEFREYIPKSKSQPVKLLIWPNKITAHRKEPVYVNIALVNDADSDLYIRQMLSPTPSLPAEYGDLLTSVVNLSTRKQAQFKPPPPPYTFEDAQRREITELVRIDDISGRRIDLRWYYTLPPSKYHMTMRFDTRFVPTFLRPDKRAWHGQTNTASADIDIAN